MPVFDYRALQTDGTIAEGHLEAGGRQEALRQIEARRMRTIRLVERNAGKGKLPFPRPNGRAASPAPAPSANPAPTSSTSPRLLRATKTCSTFPSQEPTVLNVTSTAG